MRLAAGDRAPSFSLPDAAGEKVRLQDLRGQRVLLYAYPAALTPGCTTQACDFRDRLPSFAGIPVLGISPDDPDTLARFRDQEALPFTLLSDPRHTVLEKYGAWGEKQNYGKTYLGVIRSTFVISPQGLIEHAFNNVKATGHVAKLIRDLKLS
jgi:peroxiredoxin Q/BCP